MIHTCRPRVATTLWFVAILSQKSLSISRTNTPYMFGEWGCDLVEGGDATWCNKQSKQNMLVNLELKMHSALAMLFRHFTHNVFLCSSCNGISVDWDSCFPPQHETGSCMLKSQLKLPHICGAIMQNDVEAVRFCFFTSKAEWKRRYKKGHSELFWFPAPLDRRFS